MDFKEWIDTRFSNIYNLDIHVEKGFSVCKKGQAKGEFGSWIT